MIVFIADFFDALGGAEQNDSILINHLASKHKIKCVLSHVCTIDELRDSSFVIIGNFVNLNHQVKNYITNNKKYIIYEHDHKYVKTRDPSRYNNFEIPESDIVNYEFYKHAKKVVCLGQKQVDIIKKSLNIDNLHSISSSLWSDDRLNLIRTLSSVEKKKEIFGIVNSGNSIKNTAKAVQYCEAKNISYELFSSSDPEKFLTSLASYEGLVFFPGVLESMCRLVVEAKMLNCKVITNPKLLGAYYEPWFNSMGQELIEKISANVKSALEYFESEIAS